MTIVWARRKFTVLMEMFLEGQMSAVNDECRRQPSTVTCVEVKEQVYQCIWDNWRISIDEHS
jgi:hypothetical protein